MASVLFALGLLILIVLIGLAFMWQGSLRMPGGPVAYGVEESIKYITPRLAPSTREAIGSKSVRRILEWELRYLQEQLETDQDDVVVIGGSAVRDYILEQTSRQGYDYDPEVVTEIMELQAEYMESIGALASPVAEEELKTLGLDDE